MAPLYLGVKGVIALSFARIHMDNLINSGILPLTFENFEDYGKIAMMDDLVIENAREQVQSGEAIRVKNLTQGWEFATRLSARDRQRKMLLAGGLLNATKQERQERHGRD